MLYPKKRGKEGDMAAGALMICVLLRQVCAGSVAGLPIKGGIAFQALHLNPGTFSVGSKEASGFSNSRGCKVGAERLASSRCLLTEIKAAAGGSAKGKKKGGGSKVKKAGGFGSTSGGFGGSSSSKAAAGEYDICELYKQVLANNEAKLSEKEYRNKGVSLSLGEGTNVGLVANHDIKAGELIMASKAFEIAFEGECGGSIETVNGEVVTPDEIKLADKIIAKCKQLGPDSPEARAVACMFAGNGFSHPSDAGRLQVLSGDAAAATSAAFQEGEGVPELVRERVIGIIKCNAFSPAASFGFAADRRSPMLPSQDRHLGLWVLPAMLNHACVGNCQRFFVGDFMFIRAAQDIAAGEELCHSYVDPFASVSARQAHTASFGFACGCSLCKQDEAFEQKGKGSKEVASRMLDYTEGSLGDLIKKAMTGGDREEAIASLISCIDSIETSLGDEVKWKRTLLRPYQSLGTLYEMTGDHARAADARSKAYSTCSEPRGGVGAANVQWAVEAMVSFARAGMTKEAEEWRDVAREGWKRSIGDTKLFNLFYGKVIAHYLP